MLMEYMATWSISDYIVLLKLRQADGAQMCFRILSFGS
jgi:hypothetical protein